jgi:hypothetical protein
MGILCEKGERKGGREEGRGAGCCYCYSSWYACAATPRASPAWLVAGLSSKV